jgi:hypothetical protein
MAKATGVSVGEVDNFYPVWVFQLSGYLAHHARPGDAAVSPSGRGMFRIKSAIPASGGASGDGLRPAIRGLALA